MLAFKVYYPTQLFSHLDAFADESLDCNRDILRAVTNLRRRPNDDSNTPASACLF